MNSLNELILSTSIHVSVLLVFEIEGGPEPPFG